MFWINSTYWIKRYGISLKKSLGQNFLTRESLAEKIVAIPDDIENKTVLEIGAGAGAITAYLLKRHSRVYAVEIDRRLADLLNERFGEDSNFHLITADFMDVDMDELSQGEKLFVISNLPYSKAMAIIRKLTENIRLMEQGVFMLQKEVCDRIASPPSKKSYGSLSVYIQYHYNVERKMRIPKDAFVPRPKIDSEMIVLIPKKTFPLGENPKSFFDFVKKGFATRRKKLTNNYSDKKMIRDALLKMGKDDNTRAEELALNEWISLYKEVMRGE